MRVFLDIGAHLGETLRVALEPAWRFDRIVCFEPAPSCWPALERLADERVEICRFGLWSRDERIPLYNEGTVGASVSGDKAGLADAVDCEFVDAASWFEAQLDDADEVYAKVNVEGAEAELVARLASTDLLGRIDHLLLHLDVRKVPSKAHLADEIVAQLDAAGTEHLLADQILFGALERGTRDWLRWCDADPRTRDLRYLVLGGLVGRARQLLYPLKARVTGRAAG